MSQTKDKRPEKKQTEKHPIKEAFQSSVDEVKQKAGETGEEIIRETKSRARRLFSEQRNAVAREVEGFAKAFRDTGRSLEVRDFDAAAQYSAELATEVERFAEYIREKDMAEIIDSVEDFGRRQPTLFYGSMFAAGLLLARFLKSSSPQPNEASDSYRSREQQSTSNPEFEAAD